MRVSEHSGGFSPLLQSGEAAFGKVAKTRLSRPKKSPWPSRADNKHQEWLAFFIDPFIFLNPNLFIEPIIAGGAVLGAAFKGKIAALGQAASKLGGKKVLLLGAAGATSLPLLALSAMAGLALLASHKRKKSRAPNVTKR